MSGRAGGAFGARRGRLRCFAVGILLLAVSAFVLQAAVHASPGGHAVHQDWAAATARHCAEHHMPSDHDSDPSAGCVSDDTGLSPMDCCQACPVAAVLVEPLTFAAPVNGVPFSDAHADPCEQSPDGILRPPRLIAA